MKPPTILHLVIYNETSVYKDMLEVQRTYVHSFPNVTTFFVQYRPQEEPVTLEGDFIFVRGEETGDTTTILRKCIMALQFVISRDFDFVLRSNISTITNFSNLTKHLTSVPATNLYTGGNIENLQWLDFRSGIFNKDMFGTIYAQGTAIILSRDIAQALVQHRHSLPCHIVDDVAIGWWIRNHAHVLPIHQHKPKYCFGIPRDVNEFAFFRNKNVHRQLDVQNMQIIVQKLLSCQDSIAPL
jgi:hypothetical protein